MKRLLFVLILVVLLVPMSIPVGAQSDIGSEIPACSPSEILEVGDMISNAAGEYSDIASAMADIQTMDQVTDLLNDLDDLQVEFNSEVVPDLPRCALAIESATLVNRMIDETLLAAAFMLLGDMDRATVHLEQLNEVSAQMTEYADQLSG